MYGAFGFDVSIYEELIYAINSHLPPSLKKYRRYKNNRSLVTRGTCQCLILRRDDRDLGPI